MLLSKNKIQIEEEIIQFLMSRIKAFQRIDCEMTLELIANKNNMSIEYVRDIVGKHLQSCDKIAINNSSFILKNLN